MLISIILAATIGSLKVCSACHEQFMPRPLTDYEVTQTLHRASKRSQIALSNRGYRAARRICRIESDNNPQCSMRGTTSYGLWGFLDSTRKRYGITKQMCHVCQTRAALAYIRDRYKTPERALAFHQKRGYY